MTRPERGMTQRATMAEAATLAALHQKAFPPYEAWTQAAFEALLALETTRAYASYQDGACLGLLVLQCVADQAEILTMATDPVARRQGLGRQILAHAAAEPASQTIKSWWLDVAADNPGARAFYHELGFQSDGRRPQYYKRLEGQRVDAILMSKQVGGQPTS